MMPEEVRVGEGDHWDSVASYRNYYLVVKRPLLKWKNRQPPDWVTGV